MWVLTIKALGSSLSCAAAVLAVITPTTVGHGKRLNCGGWCLIGPAIIGFVFAGVGHLIEDRKNEEDRAERAREQAKIIGGLGDTAGQLTGTRNDLRSLHEDTSSRLRSIVNQLELQALESIRFSSLTFSMNVEVEPGETGDIYIEFGRGSFEMKCNFFGQTNQWIVYWRGDRPYVLPDSHVRVEQLVPGQSNRIDVVLKIDTLLLSFGEPRASWPSESFADTSGFFVRMKAGRSQIASGTVIVNGSHHIDLNGNSVSGFFCDDLYAAIVKNVTE